MAGVGTDTAFTLTSLDGRSAVALASRLVADPPIAFVVRAGTGATAIATPAQPLVAGALYRISLTRPDGSVEAAWAARTPGPLHVESTVPGDAATRVPTDTGIEVRFDQDGVTTTDLQAHFSISPSTAGRFEASGRSIAFVPSQQLRKGTIYTVTVKHGLPIAGTSQVLGEDVVIRFETASTATRPMARVAFRNDLYDATPRERAALSVWVDVPEDAKAPSTVPLTAHRLAGLDAAMAAWEAVASAPEWAEVSGSAPVATGKLPRVASAKVALHDVDGQPTWVQLPGSLPVGWYVVTMTYGGLARQAVLQVTDAATFAIVATDRTAVWVNDLRTGKPAVGATASIGGRSLAGTTDARGLLTAATPAAVTTAADGTPMLVVRYRGLDSFQPVAGCGDCYTKEGRPVARSADPWWSYLATDRRQYRATDTVNAYGIVRDRASDAIPGTVTVAVYTGNDDRADPTPVVSARVTPDARGMFHGAIPLRDLPVGSYRLVASTGTTDIREVWFEVITIRKPAFSIAVSTNRHAILNGAKVTASVHTAFFEGTPVAGSTIRLMRNYYEGSEDSTTLARVTTSTSGDASGKVALRLDGDDGQWTVIDVSAVPALPEEAEIHDSTPVAVFRATAVLSAEGAVSGGRVVTTGAVNSVAWSRFETAAGQADPWSVDPAGAGRRNAAVRVSTIAHIPYRVQNGTAYDFVTKRVAPVYEWRDRTVTLAARTVRTGADGKYRVTIGTYPNAASYEITATYTDEGGRRITAGTWASTGVRTDASTSAWLENAGTGHDDGLYSVGDPVRVVFTGGVEKPKVTRYLFAITGGGLRYATVGSSPTFRTTFTAGSVPSIGIRAVRFNGAGFEITGTWQATLRLDDRRLTVQVTPDKTRYEPGGTASITVRALDPTGRPVVASVFVGVADEKLYAMGAAAEEDALATLYEQQPDGVIAQVASHRTVADEWGGGGYGDTTGGGGSGEAGRTEFKDWLLARIVTTGTDGRATVTVPLSDDLTSWRAVATALDSRLEAGSGSAAIPVGLPFFVDAVVADQYLASDHPIVRVRSYGTSLSSSARVTFTISSDTLPMAPVTVTADAFHAAEVALPGLSVGSHRLRIAGETGTGAARLTDVMTRTFSVVTTRATQLRTTWTAVTAPMAVASGSSLTGLTLVDAGRGRVIPLLQELAVPDFTRSDRVLASALANRVLVEQFGLDAVSPTPEDGLNPFARWDGVSIVPWSSAELDASVLAVMTGDNRVNRDGVAQMLGETVGNTELPRERRLLALAGLAALDEPVLGDIRAAATLTDLAVDEEVDLALAALFAGDEALAGRLEQQVLAEHGLQRGGQVRVDPDSPADPSVVTARLAIVAASLGDPVAADMDAWLDDNPPAATTIVAERALAARGWATRVAGATSVVALTVDGQRRQVTVEPGSPVALALTPAQAASARLEPVSGAVLIVQRWDDALTPASVHADGGVALKRTVSPTGTIHATDTVVVTLTVTLPSTAAKGCWRVVDLAPSGLAPIAGGGSADVEWTGTMPDRVDGQRVEFCVGVDPKRPVHTLRYVARVVSPGTYTWESAVMQSTFDPGIGVVLRPVTVRIAGAGS